MDNKPLSIQLRHFAIWSERNTEKRNQLIAQTYATDVKIIDPHFVAQGWKELDQLIGGLQNKFPLYQFTLRQPVETHHNVSRIFWQLGSAEKPDVELGMDIIILEDGLIKLLVIFIDISKI